MLAVLVGLFACRLWRFLAEEWPIDGRRSLSLFRNGDGLTAGPAHQRRTG